MSGDQGGGAGRGEITKALNDAVADIRPKNSEMESGEMEALTKLFMMAALPTGEENPRALLALMSDKLVEHIAARLEEAKKNQMVAQVCQFFLIEWCYRNGYLNGDWIWNWSGARQGQLHYDPRIPLSTVPLPKKA